MRTISCDNQFPRIPCRPHRSDCVSLLVASDGTFAHVTRAREVTDANLRNWIAALS